MNKIQLVMRKMPTWCLWVRTNLPGKQNLYYWLGAMPQGSSMERYGKFGTPKDKRPEAERNPELHCLNDVWLLMAVLGIF